MCKVHWVLPDDKALEDAALFVDGSEAFWLDALPVAEELQDLPGIESVSFTPAVDQSNVISDEQDFELETLEQEECPSEERDPSWEPVDSSGPLVRQSARGSAKRVRAAPKATRSRARGRSSSSEEEKRMRNREIQARYRAKKKAQRNAIETEYNSLFDDLERAHEEHEARIAKVALLEKLRSAKEAFISVLEHSGREAAKAKTALADAAPFDAKTTLCLAKSDVIIPASESLLPRSLVDGVYRALCVDAGHPISTLSEAYTSARHLLQEQKTLGRSDPRLTLSLTVVQKMSGEQLVAGWGRFAQAVRGILAVHEEELHSSPNGQAQLDLEDPPAMLAKVIPLFQEQMVVLSMALQCNLPAVEQLFAVSPGNDAESHWGEVARSLRVTESQKEHLLKQYEIYRSSLESQRAIRAQAMEKLRAATHRPMNSLSAMVDDYLELFNRAEALNTPDHTELNAVLNMMRGCGPVLTMYQKMKLVATAYPAFPDVVQIVAALDGCESESDVC